MGRTLDWRTPIPTNLYVYPAGMEKVSMPSGPRYEWVSKYGSVLAVGYDGGVTEGMNERGLVMNGLFCKTGSYRSDAVAPDGTPVMSLAVLVSYFLDNFATVDEAYEWFSKNDFAISGTTFDGGTVSQLHWAITDATGNTMFIEYEGGKTKLYRGRELQVLTNGSAADAGYQRLLGGRGRRKHASRHGAFRRPLCARCVFPPAYSGQPQGRCGRSGAIDSDGERERAVRLQRGGRAKCVHDTMAQHG